MHASSRYEGAGHRHRGDPMRRGNRVLLVEDDRSIARLLELELGHRGFEIHCVFDGAGALPAIESFAPNVIVLDILLPGMDGEQILARLRRSGNSTPVIMLTARDRTSDKVRNLEIGADDYLTKPFEIDELVARLCALLRRVEPDPTVRIGELTIDPDARTVHHAGNSIDLTAREFDLLALLAANAPNVVTRATRWRLTLYHTSAILGISSLLLGIGIVALYQSVRTGVEETTQGRAVAAERLLAQGTLPSSEELVMLTEGEVYLIVRDATGAILATAGTPPLRYDELGADGDRAWQAVLASGEPATDSSRELHVTALPVDGGASGAAVVEAWKSYD